MKFAVSDKLCLVLLCRMVSHTATVAVGRAYPRFAATAIGWLQDPITTATDRKLLLVWTAFGNSALHKQEQTTSAPSLTARATKQMLQQ